MDAHCLRSIETRKFICNTCRCIILAFNKYIPSKDAEHKLQIESVQAL